MKCNYTYITKYCFGLEDTQLLQRYDLSSCAKKIETSGKKYKSLEFLDVWNENFPGDTKTEILGKDKILEMLWDFISIYEDNHLRVTTNASRDIEKYLSLRKLPLFDEFAESILFIGAVRILFDAEIKCPTAWNKLSQLLKRNSHINEYITTEMNRDHLDFFLKQVQLGGYRFKINDFSIRRFMSLNAVDRLHFFLQHINCLLDDNDQFVEYVHLHYHASMSDVLPPYYSIARFSLILLMYEFKDVVYIPIMTLVWRSIPDAYLTTIEVKDILRKMVSHDEEGILKICRTYDQIFIFPTMRPRSLKHLARTTIRKFHPIPDAFYSSSLIPSMRSYLKLDN